MKRFIKVIFANKKYDLPLHDFDSVSIGGYELDNLVINHKSIKKGHLVFGIDKSGKVYFISKGKVYLNGQKVKKGYIDIGDKISISSGSNYVLTAELCEVYERVSVRINHEMTIGKKDVCSIAIMNPKVSRLHAAFYFSGKNVRIVDLNSSNGIYVNGIRVADAYLKNNDLISIVDYDFVYLDGFLVFEKREEIDCRTQYEPAMWKDYPVIHPSPRVKNDYRTDELQITNPPNIGSKPEINIVSLLTQPVAMILVGFLISWASKSTSSMAMVYSLPMSVISVISSVVSHFIAKKKYKQKYELKISKYTEYIKKVSQELRTATQNQIKCMKEGAPETAECVTIVSDGRKEIWNRRNDDNDFLTFRIGSGKKESALKAKFQNNGFELQEDALLSKIKSETEKYRIINNAPITVDFKKNSVMGVFGDRNEAKLLVKNMIIQATTFHSYNDLKIVTLFPNFERNEWDWIKWLPHCFNEDKSRRYVACEYSSACEIIKSVADILESRSVTTLSDEYRNDKQIKLPFYLFVIADEQMVSNPSIQKLISQCSSVYGAGAVIISDTFDALPRDTSVFVELSSEKNKLFTQNGESGSVDFETDIISNEDYNRFARALAPLKLADVKGAVTLPKSITFLEGYGVRRPLELDLASKWAKPKSYKSLSVPIGVKSNGDLFMFDIHEKKHGTFGLIAGMAGSGKSEMLQSWILSMAVNFSPDEVSFVIIDFKGTGLITPFRKLPHLAGTISDIDKDISRNLIALKSEMERRKKLFDSCGAIDINDYAKKYRNGEVAEPLPITFIIIDEFAEFRIRFPDFAGEVVDSMMKTGRSLGIWPILSTQNPSGVVSEQSSANFRFKWCLKVAGPSYSSDMLGSGHTEAARITNPGRAYIKVGDYEVFEQIQSLWSGAPYNPTKNEKKEAVSHISLVGLDGRRKNLAVTEKTIGLRSYISEIDAVVNYIDAFVTENRISRARKIWTPELPEKVYLQSLFNSSFDGARWPDADNVLQVIIGLADDPISQSQYPLKLNLSGNGHTVVYGAPMTGKTNLIHTLVMSLCLSYSPDDVNIYGIDFGSLNMGMFKDYPQVGGIATGNEKEKADKLVMLVENILYERKTRFVEVGVGNLIVYRRITNEKMPFIVLVVDNLSGFLSQNPNFQDFFVNLAEMGATYGIILAATASTTNSIPQKISNSIATKFVLGMTDESSYTTILGNSARGMKPKGFAGRGLIRINDISLEYQTALPVEVNDEAEKVCEIKRISELMRNAWKGSLPQPIPIMPSVIEFGSVCSEGITLGLSTESIKPIYFDYGSSHYMLISGTLSSGKTNILKIIAKQFKNKYSSTVIVMDISANWRETSKICDRYITSIDAMDEYFEELAAELQRRKEKQGQDVTTPDCLLVVIDNFDRFIEKVSDETAKRLNAFMRIGKNLNVFLVAAGDNRKLADRNNKGDGITASLSNSRFKVMLGDCYNSHIAFDTDLNLSQRNEELESFEGLFFNGKKTTKFKAMKE